MQRFAQAKARWDARPFPDYHYEIRTSCFCVPDVTRWTRVYVQGGVVTSVQPVDPDPNFPITGNYWEPMDSLFTHLHQRMTDNDSYLAAIVVSYDPQYGYPTSIEYRAKPNIADGGAVIEVRNVTSLNRLDALSGLLRPPEEDH